MANVKKLVNCVLEGEVTEDLDRLLSSLSISEILQSGEFITCSLEQKLTFWNVIFDNETVLDCFYNEIKVNCRIFSTFILNHCSIPQFPKLEHSSCEGIDFISSTKNAIVSLKMLTKLFNYENISEKSKSTSLEALVNASLIVCLEHNSEQLWTNKETIMISKDLFKLISSTIKDLPSYLSKESTSSRHDYVYEEIFFLMKDRLLKNNWKLSPSYPIVFWGLLSQLWSDLNLDYLLPPTLLMLDDFEGHYKRLGFKCLSYILKHGSRSHLRMHDRVIVVYDLLLKQFYTKEEDVLKGLFECLPQVLDIIEREAPTERLGKRTKSDEAFETYLQCMNLENKTPLQQVYSQNLSPFLLQLSITSAKHMTTTLRIISTYLEYYHPDDEDIRINSMQGLLQLMTQAWVRVKNHGLEITECLFRLLHAISHHNYHASPQAHKSLFTLIKQCFLVLYATSPTHLHACVDAVLCVKSSNQAFCQNVQSIASLLS